MVVPVTAGSRPQSAASKPHSYTGRQVVAIEPVVAVMSAHAPASGHAEPQAKTQPLPFQPWK